MVSPPSPQFSERPLMIGTLTGMRCWKINRLTQMLLPCSTVINQPWTPGTNNAQCFRKLIQSAWKMPDDHRFMGVNCTCGFYAYYSDLHVYLNNSTIEGVIEGYGRMVVGTQGFRCERAVVKALVHPQPSAMTMLFPELSTDEKEESLMQLAAKYNVPVFDSTEEMLTHFPLSEPEVRSKEVQKAEEGRI